MFTRNQYIVVKYLSELKKREFDNYVEVLVGCEPKNGLKIYNNQLNIIEIIII